MLKPISQSSWDKSVGFVWRAQQKCFKKHSGSVREKVFLGDLPRFASMTNDLNIKENLIRIGIETKCESISSFSVAGLPFLAWKDVLVALQLASKEISW